MTEPLHWLKSRILEAEWLDPASTETIYRIHCRLRSDGSMWYQVARRNGFYDLNPDELEARFTQFLAADLGMVRAGWTEADFDQDFLERLQKMNGREVTPVVS